jgi:hypothetical protein
VLILHADDLVLAVLNLRTVGDLILLASSSIGSSPHSSSRSLSSMVQ